MHLYMHPLRWSCKHWSLLVLLSCSLGSAAGFAGSLPLVRGRVGRRVQAPHVVLAQAGEGNTRVLDALEFVIGTTFSSRLYIGSPQLHLSVPVPPPESYPEFVPTWVRLPRSVYDLVDRGVEKGWIKKAGADTIFQIKYGVLRGEVIADSLSVSQLMFPPTLRICTHTCVTVSVLKACQDYTPCHPLQAWIILPNVHAWWF